MPRKWYEGKVVKIEAHSSITKSFWVELSEEIPFDFRAGQFVTMDLPIHEKRTKRWKSYSIANNPDQSNLLEFCIVRLEGGLGTTYFFEKVEIGTTLKFKGPAGVFILPETIEKDLVLICTGTGVAPFRSMLLDIIAKNKAHKRLHLIFGTRHLENVLYKEELSKIEAELPEFKYSIALSREENFSISDSMKKGYLHQFYLEEYAEIREDVQFYICGWKDMIDDAVDKLTKMGYDKGQIYYELYG